MADWGLGEYERTAEQLAPAADVAVAALAPQAGERIVDVGCGTGNAALVAARVGASVVGIDLAPRLLAVAREHAAAEGLDATFQEGDAAALPLPDDAFDGAISVFGVIFADAPTAAAELLRVVRPGGRIVVTTWTTAGPIAKVGELMRSALGAPASPPTWADPEVLRSLFDGHDVRIEEAPLSFRAASPRAYLDEQLEHHPMWLMAAPALDERGTRAEVINGATAIFEAANEEPAAFRITSTYHVVTVTVA